MMAHRREVKARCNQIAAFAAATTEERGDRGKGLPVASLGSGFTGDRRQQTLQQPQPRPGDRGQETEDRRQETGDRRQETGGDSAR